MARDIDNHLITSVQVTDGSDGKGLGKLVDGARDTVGKVSRVFGDSALIHGELQLRHRR